MLGCHTKLGRRCKSRTKSGAELLSSLSQLKFGLFNISFLRAINSSSVFGRSTSRIVARESIAEFMPFQGESRAKASEWAIRNLKTQDRNNTSHHSQCFFFLKNNYIHCVIILKNNWQKSIRNLGISVDSRKLNGHFDAISKNYASLQEDKKYYFTNNTNL